jgi:hypothetical protein
MNFRNRWSEVGGARVDRIPETRAGLKGELKLQVWWNTEEATWDLSDMKEDYGSRRRTLSKTSEVAEDDRNPNLQWAKTLRDIKRSIRRVARHDFFLDENDVVRKVRRNNKKRRRSG